MSKIYNKYLELKRKNNKKMYLFHSGKFYIFIADDCESINNYMVLKPTRFTNEVNKCGFPSNKLNDYLKVFNNLKLDVEIIEKIEETTENKNDKYQKILDITKGIDINNITPIQSIEILDKILRCINE